METPRASLSTLPEELLSNILHYMPTKHLFRTSSVCHRVRKSANTLLSQRLSHSEYLSGYNFIFECSTPSHRVCVALPPPASVSDNRQTCRRQSPPTSIVIRKDSLLQYHPIGTSRRSTPASSRTPPQMSVIHITHRMPRPAPYLPLCPLRRRITLRSCARMRCL